MTPKYVYIIAFFCYDLISSLVNHNEMEANNKKKQGVLFFYLIKV
jgi:hypothetical protein